MFSLYKCERSEKPYNLFKILSPLSESHQPSSRLVAGTHVGKIHLKPCPGIPSVLETSARKEAR